MHDPRPRWKKWLLALVKLLVLGLLVWFLRGTLTSAFEKLNEHTWHVQPAWLVLAGLCYVVGLLPVTIFWNRVLLATDQHVGMFETIRAWWVSQIVKYIPGKAMVLVVRAGMLRDPKIETTVVAASVFVETLTMMAVGSLLSFFVLLCVNWHSLLALFSNLTSFADVLKLFENSAFLTTFAAFGMFVCMGLPTWPPAMKMIVKVLGVGKLNPTAAKKLGGVPYRVLIFGWIGITIGWFIQGLGLWATLRSLGIQASLQDLPLITAVVAMSTVAGFISLIPGGAGVREFVQTQLMVDDYGAGNALVASIIWRLVMLVSEVVLSSILYVLGPRRLKHKLGGPNETADPTPAPASKG